ncbi:MAG: hypothetical protein V3V97_03695 [Hyphomicrobiaceae bacterium]
MNCLPRAYLLVFTFFAPAWLTAMPVSAAIQCQGPNQVIPGHGLLPTPYCGDQYLAQVAASHGRRVSGASIRRNINLKADVCLQVGNDIRVSQICQGYRIEDRSSIFKN